ncbi:hypothetical protein [Vibrio phage JSF12]|uniref:Uncharacterized protein n=2 Tax=Jesfedecavirus TaxID=2560156 RepID=A0A2D0YLZ8_9CAUD|nr:hypothetical protein FDI98_gp043 [Vibrio phage JSF10]YP_009794774.1 hypothetical protein HOS35_gp091 [Vibrio phage JSF12]ASV43489.1 hypothetical protein [Vibrio phage JSF10]ASV43609.1 hypothetical protein [Vibrio phage JSF12]
MIYQSITEPVPVDQLPVLPSWAVWTKEPPISDFYKCDQTTAANVRLLKAVTFLKNQELQFPILNTIRGYDVVEQHFKNKVVTYAAAFVEGAANAGGLYYDARLQLLTWYAIFNGAVFRNGYLVEVGE